MQALKILTAVALALSATLAVVLGVVTLMMVFQDTTLRAMAQRLPATLDDLRALPGVGDAKLERYGTAFLTAIASAD